MTTNTFDTTQAIVPVDTSPKKLSRPRVKVATSDPEAARVFAASARSVRTIKEYQRDWSLFLGWLDENNYPRPRQNEPYPTEVISDYLASLARTMTPDGQQHAYKASTIRRRLATICVAFTHIGIPNPREKVEDTLAGIMSRVLNEAPTRKKAATRNILDRLFAATPCNNVIALRDRAVILFGFETAMRRSNIAGTTIDELTFEPEGLLFRTKRRRKTRQKGTWLTVLMKPVDDNPEMCPVRTMKAWLSERQRRISPNDTPEEKKALFRRINEEDGSLGKAFNPDGRDVYHIVRAAAERAGLDMTLFGAHSLRSGFVTENKLLGRSNDIIKARTEHSRDETVDIYDQRKLEHESLSQSLFGKRKTQHQ